MNASKRAVLKIAAVRDDIALQTVPGADVGFPAVEVSDMFLEEKHGALFAGQPQRRPRLGNAVFENRSG
jgi:hypothetical protein